MDQKQGYFRPLAEQYQGEIALWIKLHDSLDILLSKYGSPTAGTAGAELHGLRQIEKIPLEGNWYVAIQDLHPEVHNNYETHNRWGHEIVESVIEITLWISDDYRDIQTSIADDAKAEIICSPRGVIDGFTGEHLPVEQVENLLADIETFEVILNEA